MREGSHAGGWAPAVRKEPVSRKIDPKYEAQTLRQASHEDHEESSWTSRQ